MARVLRRETKRRGFLAASARARAPGRRAAAARARAKQAEAQLQFHENQVNTAEENSAFGSWFWDLKSGEFNFSSNAWRLLGIEKRARAGLTDALAERAHPDDQETLITAIRGQVDRGEAYDIEVRFLSEDGYRWIRARGYALRDKSAHVHAVGGSIEDITERVEMLEQLQKNEEHFRSLVSAAPFPLIITNLYTRQVIYTNAMANELFGVASDGGTLKTPDFFVEKADLAQLRADLLAQGYSTGREARLKKINGDEFWAFISCVLIEHNGQPCAYVIMHDQTERKRLEDELRQRAQFDVLTGLYNRQTFADLMADAVRETEETGEVFGLLLIDLDRFKNVNDTLGHEAGDQLLIQAATRLQDLSPESCQIARLGGDEFAILYRRLDSIPAIEELAGALISEISAPYEVIGNMVNVGCSIGIAIYPWHNGLSNELMRYADMALYKAKELGRGQYFVVDDQLTEEVHERGQLQQDMRQAIERGEFRLVYHPRMCARTRKPIAAEALLRWEHPERGPIPPDQFIPIAEETGFITVLSRWVVQTAVFQLRSWMAMGLQPLPVSLNLSAADLMLQDQAQEIGALLGELEVPPSLLQVEMTESSLLSDRERVQEQLAELAGMGVELLIDDFGTGYSSLAYLHQFQVHKLKIDRSFVQRLTHAPDALLTRQIVEIGKGLGLCVVAEGVETASQADLLTAMGCDELQGFYFNKPLDLAEYQALLEEQHEEGATPASGTAQT